MNWTYIKKRFWLPYFMILMVVPIVSSCFFEFSLDDEITFYDNSINTLPHFSETSVKRAQTTDWSPGYPLYDFSQLFLQIDSDKDESIQQNSLFSALYSAGIEYDSVVYSTLAYRPFTITLPFDFDDNDQTEYTHFSQNIKDKRWSAFSNEKENGKINLVLSWVKEIEGATEYSLLKGSYYPVNGKAHYKIVQLLDFTQGDNLDRSFRIEIEKESNNAPFLIKAANYYQSKTTPPYRFCAVGSRESYYLLNADFTFMKNEMKVFYKIQGNDDIIQLQGYHALQNTIAGYEEKYDSDYRKKIDALTQSCFNHKQRETFLLTIPENGMELIRHYIQ